MKRYFYHVSFFHKIGISERIGDGILTLPEPIKTREAVVRAREEILANCGGEGAVVLLGFQLLRIEDAEPEEVGT
jgi:hypothetical protein